MAIGLNVTTWVWAQGGTHSTSAGGDQVTDEGTLGTHGATPHGYSHVWVGTKSGTPHGYSHGYSHWAALAANAGATR